MTPGGILRLPPGRCGFVENQGRDALRVGRREGHGDETAVAGREDRRALRASRVQDRKKVVHERLDRRDIPRREPLRTAEPTPVGDDQAREARELTRESRERWVFPVHDDIRLKALEVDEVNGALSHYLVGERVLPVPCIERLGP